MAIEMAEGEPPYMDLPPLTVHSLFFSLADIVLRRSD